MYKCMQRYGGVYFNCCGRKRAFTYQCGSCPLFYSDRLQEKARIEKYVREKLIDAFDNEGFYMVYQPKVDVIKLDKTLVDNYLVDGKDAFIDDVIRLIHDLNKEMTIEGVEENWQYCRLNRL